MLKLTLLRSTFGPFSSTVVRILVFCSLVSETEPPERSEPACRLVSPVRWPVCSLRLPAPIRSLDRPHFSPMLSFFMVSEDFDVSEFWPVVSRDLFLSAADLVVLFSALLAEPLVVLFSALLAEPLVVLFSALPAEPFVSDLPVGVCACPCPVV